MTAPVIFLDIDGVLNSVRSCVALGGYPFPGGPGRKDRDWHKFDAVAVGLLRNAIEKTGAVCVLSSSWRLGLDEVELNDLAAFLGVPIIGMTRSTLGREKRGEQIRDWLSDHPEVSRWAILDDDSDMLPDQMRAFVKVKNEEGFTYAQYKRLVYLLGGRA